MTDRKIVPIHYLILVKIFEKDGFRIVRKKGDHLILTKEGIKRPLVIKTSPRQVPVTHILTNLKTSGMNRDKYFLLLNSGE